MCVCVGGGCLKGSFVFVVGGDGCRIVFEINAKFLQTPPLG